MKVKELIEVLKQMPEDAEVCHIWDGEPRTSIEFVWLAREKTEDDKQLVVTSDYDQTCYSEDVRPIGAPTERQDRYWSTPTKEGNEKFWELIKDDQASINKHMIALKVDDK